MSSRSYEMVERAESVERTRARILDAAAGLFGGDRYAQVSLDDIAKAADVSRGTVYRQFESRRGLIEALTSATEHRARFDRVLKAAGGDDPRRAFVDTWVELVRFVHEAAPLFDNLRSLAHVDADLQQMVRRKDAARRKLANGLTARVAIAGGLRVPRSRALAIVTALTGYEGVRELLEASSSVSQAQAHLQWTLRQLLREPAR